MPTALQWRFLDRNEKNCHEKRWKNKRKSRGLTMSIDNHSFVEFSLTKKIFTCYSLINKVRFYEYGNYKYKN